MSKNVLKKSTIVECSEKLPLLWRVAKRVVKKYFSKNPEQWKVSKKYSKYFLKINDYSTNTPCEKFSKIFLKYPWLWRFFKKYLTKNKKFKKFLKIYLKINPRLRKDLRIFFKFHDNGELSKIVKKFLKNTRMWRDAKIFF